MVHVLGLYFESPIKEGIVALVDFWVVEGLKTRHTDESYNLFAARSVAISVKELSRVNKMVHTDSTLLYHCTLNMLCGIQAITSCMPHA